MTAWQQLAASGILAPVDLRFAGYCHRLSGESDILALSAALLSCERADGNSCIQLTTLAGAPFPFDSTRLKPGQEPDVPNLPELGAWFKALERSELVGDGSRPTPLVLEDGRLYLYRYWKAERTISRGVADRLQPLPPPVNVALIGPFRNLFPDIGPEPDWQAAGALAALQRAFTIITGGPGTGKTHTVVRLLALLLQSDPSLRIALAAPTGKAASRLGDSISRQVDNLDVPPEIRAGLSVEVRTLHRLLGYRPRLDRFFHNASRPLPYDVVVVDEASMIDVLLMENLIRALTPRCRLVLLGDHEQLASVDTGFVLGDITRAAAVDQAHGKAFAEVYRQFTGFDIPSQEDPPPMRDSVVYLPRSRRFAGSSGIGRVSTAVRERNSRDVLAAFHDDLFRDIQLADPPTSVEASLEPVLDWLIQTIRAQTPEEALENFNKARILCARRNGIWGIENLNAAVERYLSRHNVAVGDSFYRGRPVLITRNDYWNKLYNGDVGICWPQAGRPRAWFQEADGALRDLPVSRLPSHETAWAMTIHKNQGSEFDHVLMFLPEAGHSLCNRELFYTGVTRAKKKLHLYAEENWVRSAVQNQTRRASGLTANLTRTSLPDP
ncbi:MAG: exodeoxyribonuclease V subunit alpha [Acidobacteriota bacterium]|nr:exodeoxyribonuclease V subunit alpha [Acidobacteriota bacterium]